MAGVFVAEGDIVVERALRAGYRLSSLLIDGKRTKPLPAVIDDDVPVYACAPNVLQRITGYHLHRGVLACFHRKPLLGFGDALGSARTVAVMEGINNPTNLGVILRCAIGLGVEAYFLDRTCCDPLYRRCGRVSMGEAFDTPYARLDPLPDGLEPLHRAGFETLALTPSASAISGTARTIESPCSSAPRARVSPRRRWHRAPGGSASPCRATWIRSTSAPPPQWRSMRWVRPADP